MPEWEMLRVLQRGWMVGTTGTGGVAGTVVTTGWWGQQGQQCHQPRLDAPADTSPSHQDPRGRAPRTRGPPRHRGSRDLRHSQPPGSAPRRPPHRHRIRPRHCGQPAAAPSPWAFPEQMAPAWGGRRQLSASFLFMHTQRDSRAGSGRAVAFGASAGGTFCEGSASLVLGDRRFRQIRPH